MVAHESHTAQQASLLRLLQADAEAHTCLEEARTRAHDAVCAANTEAARLLQKARTEAQSVAETTVQSRIIQASAAADALLCENQQALQEMATRATYQLEGAAQFVVNWVIRKGA